MRKLTISLATISVVVIIAALVASPGTAIAQSSQPQISVDEANGRVTVENGAIKGVWHYKAIAAENFNQGGGNLYELYHKQSDPGFSKNLASFTRMTGWGNGRSTAIWIGVGGSGSTTLYAADVAPASNQTYGFNDFLGDNNVSGTLESKSVFSDSNGDAVLRFRYVVRNQSTGISWYRIDKQWTIQPDGVIRVKLDWLLLRDGWYSEPAAHFKWSREMFWDRWEKYGIERWPAPPSKHILSSDGLVAKYLPHDLNEGSSIFEAFSPMNFFNVDWVSFVGSETAPDVTMTNGLGFTGGTMRDHTMEQNIGETRLAGRVIGEYGMHWTEWWGGNPAPGSRYQWLTANTSWSDDFQIMVGDMTDMGPDIQSVGYEPFDGAIRVSWSTDVPANSVVEIKGDDGRWRQAAIDQAFGTNHEINVPLDNTAVTYRVASTDAQGKLSISGDYPAQGGGSHPVINISALNTYWASYADYTRRILSTEFQIRNENAYEVQEVRINSVRTNSGVLSLSEMPAMIGDINQNSSAVFLLEHLVPAGISGFVTKLEGSARNSFGAEFSFPS